MDLYSLFTSIRSVLEYFDRVDPQAARIARESCLTPWLRHIHVGNRANASSSGCGPSESARTYRLMRAHIGPVRLHRDDPEPVRTDEVLDASAHAIELGGAVRRLTEQHQSRPADVLEQGAEVAGVDGLERLGDLADQSGERGRGSSWPATDGCTTRPARRPALNADQRDEAHVAEFLAVKAAIGLPPDAKELRRVDSHNARF